MLKICFSGTAQLLLISAIAGTLCAAQAPTQSVKYEGATDNFVNPERGFFIQRGYPTRGPAQAAAAPAASDAGALTLEDLRSARDRQMSVARLLYNLRDYREAPLPEDLLKRLAADFDRARTAGVKVIPRFSYSSAIGQPDAAVERVLAHIEQLRPILQANADLIMVFEAGFAGAWGEWHSSTNGLFDTGPGIRYPKANDKTRAILEKLLDVLPKDRMVVVRCPRFKTGFYGDAPVTIGEAFDGSNKSRVGHLNDCFLASANDSGTYTDRMAEEKAMMHQENLYLPFGGETCGAGPAAQKFVACDNALKEMEYLRINNLNNDYNRAVITVWEKGGCLPEMERRIGYRYRLIEAAIPAAVKPGAAFQLSFTLTNEGFADLNNPRPVEVVLRNKETRKTYTLALSEDPRLWLPGETKKVAVEGGIPASAPAGAYEVLINLPDASKRLRDRPEYSVRMANTGVWEQATGMNSLKAAVKLDSKTPGAAYKGKTWFK